MAARPSSRRRSFGILAAAAWPKIGDAAVVGQAAQRAVETGPALGVDVALQRGADVPFGAGTKLQGDARRGAVAQTVADVVAADDEVFAVVSPSAHQNVDVRVVGVPVIDRHPVEPGPEISLDVSHQLPGEGSQALEVLGVLRRDDEAEVVAVILTTLGEGALVRGVGAGVEQARLLTISRDTVARQIGEVTRQRRGPEPRPGVAGDARLDHDPAAAGTKRQRRPPPASEARGAGPGSAAPEGLADMAGLLGRAGDLAHEASDGSAALRPMPDAARADVKIVVTNRHRQGVRIGRLALGSL